MAGRFAPERQRALQELLGLPAKLRRNSVPRTDQLEIAAVCEVLDLPEPSCRAWLAPDRWLLGGAVLHWLWSQPGEEMSGPLDYDLFFSSLDALNQGITDLFAAGFTFSCFHLWGDLCPFCGLAGSLESRNIVSSMVLPLTTAVCHACESTGSVGKVPITAEALARSGLVSIDLLSPRGEVFQLAAIAFEPSLKRLKESADYSVCQFGLDDRNLHFGRYTWTDLFSGRLRVENLQQSLLPAPAEIHEKGFFARSGNAGPGVWLPPVFSAS